MIKGIINSNFNLLTNFFYNKFLLYFSSSLISNLKKNDSENVPTLIHDFECRLCAQTQ